MSKQAVLGWFEEWLPLLVPAALLFGKLVAALKANMYTVAQLPSDVSYYGATIYVWALTNHLTGGRFSLSDAGNEGPYILLCLLANLGVYYWFFPSYGKGSHLQLGFALALSFVLGPAGAIYLRVRI